ncbi:SMODS domain-containing nucleotidyltransferase [Microvirga brassicacearum]|uniref:Nucleotidyltransferase n=1 Tax=Microvirga brassicacearum TaxID=2580413 RepID=A0A5N3P5W6_9HYPH|nr:nucleotidyltransferase [Microvirga brassicacearum]KAB0265137.1 nucleotidyltransferase [Microvirga brassicacearum]
MWAGVFERFRRFHADCNLTPDQIDDGYKKALGVCRSVERAYYGEPAEKATGFLVGSWGKSTQLRPPNDVDLFVRLPWDVYTRFEQRAGNKQSALLQEVKSALGVTYPQTNMRGDGQVVMVQFNTILIEVLPVFQLSTGQYLMPDANDGGHWKMVDPVAQINFVDQVNQKTNGNLRAVTKMMKLWSREQNVPIKSFVLELLLTEFFASYGYGPYSYYWYDFFIRDAFRFLVSKAWGTVIVPGTNEVIPLGGDWLSRAQRALDIALQACAYEHADMIIHAGDEWQKIFGTRIPRSD